MAFIRNCKQEHSNSNITYYLILKQAGPKRTQ